MSSSENPAPASPDTRQWYVRMVAGGAVFGPIRTAGLVVWASEGRVMPDDEVSEDKVHWRPAQEIPELCMDTLIAHPNGSFIGPFHRDALQALIREGKIPPDAKPFPKNELGERLAARQMTLFGDEPEEPEDPKPRRKRPAPDPPAPAPDAAELSRLRAERDEAIAARDAAATERDEAIAARDAAATKRDEAIAARDAAAAERDEAIAARDAAATERDEAIAARDSAASERDEAIVARDTAATERDEAIAARDAAATERDEAIAARDSAATERDAAIAARDAAEAEAVRLREELAAAKADQAELLAFSNDRDDGYQKTVASLEQTIMELRDRLSMAEMSPQTDSVLQERLRQRESDVLCLARQLATAAEAAQEREAALLRRIEEFEHGGGALLPEVTGTGDGLPPP